MTAEYDITRKSYKYSIDDWQLLVNILHEYGDKLTSLSRRISMEKNRPGIEFRTLMLRIRAIVYITLFLLSLLIALFLVKRKYLLADAITGSIDVGSMSFYIFYAMIIPACLIIVVILTKNRKEDTDIPINLIEGDAIMMSSRLESAIRLTIAVSDQVEISLAKKLEMDLRIDEAKSALDYYYSVVGAKKAS